MHIKLIALALMLLPATCARADYEPVPPSIQLKGVVDGHTMYYESSWGNIVVPIGDIVCGWVYESKLVAYRMLCVQGDKVVAEAVASCRNGEQHVVGAKVTYEGNSYDYRIYFECSRVYDV